MKTILQLFLLQLKDNVRSAIFGKKLATSLLLLFFALYILGSVIFVGFFLNLIIEEVYPNREAFSVFNSFILYYFFVDLVLRLFFQKLPVLKVQPFLLLPIKRKEIAHYLQASTLLYFSNFIPLLLAIPFGIQVIYEDFGVISFTNWLLTITVMLLASNVWGSYMKWNINSKLWIAILIAVAVGLFIALDVLGFYSLMNISELAFNLAVFGWPFTLLGFLLLLILGYSLNTKMILENIYLESLPSKQKSYNIYDNFANWFHRFGEIGEWMTLELKLIFRNKRPRTVFFMGILFSFYGLIFYLQPLFSKNEYNSMFIFAGIFSTGGIMINYGQFLFSWESAYFDGLATRKVDSYTYLKSKWILTMVFNLICYIATLPLIALGINIFYINTACFIYNSGASSLILILLATTNKKRISLTKSASFNWEGMSATQWLASFPVFAIPMLIYLPFQLFQRPVLGLQVLAGLGVLNALLFKVWLKMGLESLGERRYKMLAGFRQN